MRVSPVNNYGQTNNVAFGRFADENARKVVKKALATDDWVMKPVYDSWFKRIEDDENFTAYTDKKSGKVKGKFDDEFVRNNSDASIYSQRVIKNGIERLKKFGALDDLSIFGNVEDIANYLWNFQEVLKGVDLSEKWRSKKPHGDARVEEKAKEDFLNNLAD